MVNSYFTNNASLFDWFKNIGEQPDILQAVKPATTDAEHWPPNYRAIYAWRIEQLEKLRADPDLLKSAKAYYSTRPDEFIMHWMDTYDPRKKNNKWMPFVFFPKQREFIQFIYQLYQTGESGLAEKCRDAGATWCSCGFSVWAWVFINDFAGGWGSRKSDLVDKLGNPDSIFEKMRLLIDRLPDVFKPEGFDKRKHATYMKLINPDNGSIIMGEAGDNIGRGGRTSIYFKDESAHYERPELIEAALGNNTEVQIDISSVNGLGNVFHRRREAGVNWQPDKKLEPGYVQVFVIDWRDHPEKTQQWYDIKKAKHEREGLLHVFAQEVDRNYSAAVQNTIIPYEWIEKAVDAHKKIKWKDDAGNIRIGFEEKDIPNIWGAGLDVADGGIDRNAASLRQWIIWRDVEEWGERDTGVTTRKMLASVRGKTPIKIQYDVIGVGAGVKAEFNRLVDEKLVDPKIVKLVPWNAGAAVVDPFDHIIPDDEDSILNKDYFENMKAQAWLSIRSRFYKTFKNITEGIFYPVEELISLDSSMKLLHQLMKELAQPTMGPSKSLRTMVNKKPDGTKSPNLADCGIQMYFPIEENKGHAISGKYGS